MLVAPLRLVLLQGPNCSAILSFLRSAVKAWCQCMLHYPMQLPRPLELQRQQQYGGKAGDMYSKKIKHV